MTSWWLRWANRSKAELASYSDIGITGLIPIRRLSRLRAVDEFEKWGSRRNNYRLSRKASRLSGAL